MSVKQSEIIPGVYNRVMNFDWCYTDQSGMYAIFIVSSKSSSGFEEPEEKHDNRVEGVILLKRVNNFHLNVPIVLDLNERCGEEIDFEY